MSFLLESVLKTSGILTIALLAGSMLRRLSASTKHWILSSAVVLAALIPLASISIPSWHLAAAEPLPPAAIALSTTAPTVQLETQLQMPVSMTAQIQAVLPVAIWLAGVALSLLAIVVGSVRLARITASSHPIKQGRWHDLSEDISREYRLRRSAYLLQSPNPSILMTWGFLKPKVVLPAGADSWTDDRAGIVLSHELAHVRRGDWVIQLVAELLRAIYWFNPLVWIVCKRLRMESEYACDDAALERGIEGADYASELLELARDLNVSETSWSAALAMARPSTIERRFQAMLNPSLNRRAVTSKTMLAIAILALVVALPIGMLSSSPAPQAPTSGVAGTVLDNAGAAVRSATVIVSTPGGQTEVTTTTNASGRFGFANLPEGTHVLQVYAPGFGPSRITNIELKAGQQLTQDVEMDIGFVAAQEAKPAASQPRVIANPLPAAAAFGQGTIKGTVSDATGAVVPGVEVSLLGNNNTRTTVTDETGSFALSQAPTGPYRIVVALPGFKTINMDGVLNADGDVVTVSPKLAVAPTAEEMTVRAIAGSSSESPALETPAQCLDLPPAPALPPAHVPNAISVPGRIRQGGNVQQAMLLGQTKPVYPSAAKMSGTQGPVIMEAVIGRDGRLLDVKVISGAPVLAAAAVDAVSRWCYRPTHLNGEPVEVVTTVSVNFVLQ